MLGTWRQSPVGTVEPHIFFWGAHVQHAIFGRILTQDRTDFLSS